MKSLFVFGLLAVAAVGLWLIPQRHKDGDLSEPGVAVAASAAPISSSSAPEPQPVGTSGTHEADVEADDAAIVREIETITGANDAMALVGRKVDLHVDVQHLANDQAFWVGPRDNRVLVVLARDNRSGVQRQEARSATHRVVPVHNGQPATISGVIRPLPVREQMASWNLTETDRKEAADRKIYIRADSVGTLGHGTF